ncbi:hypothetical protein QBZ16_004423 [Prototheca wickerhamii]|uniref:SEC7 domain-containing protein n=1 Tax=Prototheca wickerhamii TaxID=3111 RepID=A0AAD9IHB3_PROWI|nr:hypothetical protein QBZ16_004423 [Prototheca wickerhamii]
MVGPIDLVKPPLEKLLYAASGRRYAQLRTDIQALLDELESLLALQPEAGPERVGSSAPAEEVDSGTGDKENEDTAPASQDPGVAAQLSASEDGVRLTLTLAGEGLADASADAAGSAPASMRELGEALEAQPLSPHSHPGALRDAGAARLLNVLQEAVESKRPPLVEPSLELLQRLIAHGLVQGTVTQLEHRSASGGPEAPSAPLSPAARAVDLVVRCDEIADDGVELRLLSALLTAVTSSTLLVHGSALLLCIRAGYNVYLLSRSEVNAATAKAALTQALNVCFARMESGDPRQVPPPIMVADVLGLPPAESSSLSAGVQQFLTDVVASVDPFGTHARSVAENLDAAFVAEGGAATTPTSARRGSGHPVDFDTRFEDGSEDREGIDWERNKKRGGDEGRRDGGTQNGKAGDAGGAPSSAISTPLSPPPAATLRRESSSFRSDDVDAILQRSAYLVFRALCKLSIQSEPGNDATTAKGKVLALELLKIVLENSGPVFAASTRFVGAIRQHLCLSLLKNCASSVPAALPPCASIFLTLYARFRRELKAEVGVFYPVILLRPIEPLGGPTGGVLAHTTGTSGAAPVDAAYRAVALACLGRLVTDGQALIDLYVNYDCDLEGSNLFERTIAALVRTAQGGAGLEAAVPGAAEERGLRYEALRCLVAALRSASAWSAEQQRAADRAIGSDLQQASAGLAKQDAEARAVDGRGAARRGRESAGLAQRERAVAGRAGAPAPSPQRPMGSDLEGWKAFKRVYQEGVALFNAKPRRGIEFMQQQRLVGEEPGEVASFLARTRALDKTQIGDYLGEREPFNLKVMHAYVDALDFTGLDFDGAIRRFLQGFRLPGEAQKIDRLMEKFAERYVACNPGAFRSADVAYVLAYSVILLNTDAHNPGVKVKMSKADFLRNNRGINDGGDLDPNFMGALYDRIVRDEIRLKDESEAARGAAAAPAAAGDADVRRRHEALRLKAQRATWLETHDPAAVLSALDVAWAPVLGALSTVFEETDDPRWVVLCLAGFVAAANLACALRAPTLRDAYVSSLARFTMLHNPGALRLKHAQAFRALLVVAEANGNALGPCWQDVLRCVSRFELLQNACAGVPSDATLFGRSGGGGWRGSLRGGNAGTSASSSTHPTTATSSSINDMGLHGLPGDVALPPPAVMASVAPDELDRVFSNSTRLDSDAIVGFAATLCAIAREELRPADAPRVFSLTKIVELAAYNMDRIRLVWSRIWAVLADFFLDVGCAPNLQVAMYGVDSLRQLATKFLERDELANFSFQSDFLRPFCAIMRRSRSVEIRELVIRCVSQLVLARVGNVKSGWKSVFMVYATAAGDESPAIVRLAFDTVEKIVREHFAFITETEAATFTDCVNCLTAYTNNPHSLDVALNSIAFLRFCALQLAAGGIGDVDALPEGGAALVRTATGALRIRARDAAGGEQGDGRGSEGGGEAREVVVASVNGAERGLMVAEPSSDANPAPTPPQQQPPTTTTLRFTDKEQHMYFWFPLLAGLSELTFDPRPQIRTSALEVLFDILMDHGSAFTAPFWLRVFDSVLLPIFDIVRAQTADATTFTDEARRLEADGWLYETCTRALQNLVDLVVRYHGGVPALLARLLELLGGFIARPHAELASVGVAALTRLTLALAPALGPGDWGALLAVYAAAAEEALPDIAGLLKRRQQERFGGAGDARADEAAPGATAWSLGRGAGARRLAEVRVRVHVSLLLVQAAQAVCAAAAPRLPPAAAGALLDLLAATARHARGVDADVSLRHGLALAQAADGVPAPRCLPDPPLLSLEAEAAEAYVAALGALSERAGADVVAGCGLRERLAAQCLGSLARYEDAATASAADGEPAAAPGEAAALAPLAVSALRALRDAFDDEAFRAHARELFPHLVALVAVDGAPAELRRALADVFMKRVGAMLVA